LELNSLIRRFDFDDINDFYFSIGENSAELNSILQIYLLEVTSNYVVNPDIEEQLIIDANSAASATELKELSDIKDFNFEIAKCCSILPGDSIFGIKKHNDLIEVHNIKCSKYSKFRHTHPTDLVSVE
jgi:(p)ppGpp synthase/HD superfamily hydrolase